MRRTTLCFCRKLLQLSGVWTFLMNIYMEKNSSFSSITSFWKVWVTSIPIRSTGCKQHFLNMILLFNIKKGQLCQLCLSRLPLLQVESHTNIVQLSTLFKPIFQSFRTRIQISKPFFTSSKPLNGFCISTNDN